MKPSRRISSILTGLLNFLSRIELSHFGVFWAVLFLLSSLTPSLLPRHYLMQAILSGISAGVGYGFGNLFGFLWWFLEIPTVSQSLLKKIRVLFFILFTPSLVFMLANFREGQNSVRGIMGLPALQESYSVSIVILSVLTFFILLFVSRLLQKSSLRLGEKLKLILPPRISILLGFAAVMLIVFSFIDGFILKKSLHIADTIFAKMNLVMDKNINFLDQTDICGGRDSFIKGSDLGYQGRRFIFDGPRRSQIQRVTHAPAKEPIRVYSGYLSAKEPVDRAALAVKELIRLKGFERAVLVIGIPTGAGWLDQGGVDTLEYLHHGDTAIVSMQYSYLPSWLTIAIDPDRSRKAAKILFDTVFKHWSKMDKNTRPKLYLFGLSLGALGAEVAVDLVSTFPDFVQGAVFSGPPFASTMWPQLVAAREPGSPAWLPKFRGGSLVRFMSRSIRPDKFDKDWGPIRIVYLQHGSDPMSFFSPQLLFHQPEWLQGQRASDVSPLIEWHPIVTFLQVAFDVPMSISVPSGFGHNFSPAEYIDAWLEVSQPQNLSSEDIVRVKKHFTNYTHGL